MCFSAAASFTTAAATGLAGLICMTEVKARREVLLAAAPLGFAAQQAVEGFLWLLLPQGASSTSAVLTYVFLFAAQVFWPVYAPAAVMLCEPNIRRRRAMAPFLACGAGVSLYLLAGLVSAPHRATLACDHIVYDIAKASPSALAIGAAYLGAIGAPLLISSFSSLRVLGLVVLAGCLVSYGFYFAAFQSVWCYFAAAASVVIVGHFHHLRSTRRILVSLPARPGL